MSSRAKARALKVSTVWQEHWTHVVEREVRGDPVARRTVLVEQAHDEQRVERVHNRRAHRRVPEDAYARQSTSIQLIPYHIV